jgi:hypothetical protein
VIDEGAGRELDVLREGHVVGVGHPDRRRAVIHEAKARGLRRQRWRVDE